MIESKFTFRPYNPYDQQKYLKFFDIAFNLPGEKISFSLPPPFGYRADGDELQIKLKYNFDRLVQTVDRLFVDPVHGEAYEDAEGAKLELKTSLWEHIMASADRYHTKSNLFIVGPPGVGKTRIIGEIGKSLNIPVVSLNLGIVKDATDLFGSEEKAGALLQAISTSPVLNAILLADEASETFNDPLFAPSLKTLTEPELGQFESPYLKLVKVPFLDFLLVALGNGHMVETRHREVQEKSQGALESRFKIFNFPEFKPGFIDAKARELVKKMLENHYYVRNLEDLENADDDTNQVRESKYQALVSFNEIIKKSLTLRDLEKFLPSWCMSVNEWKKRTLEDH